MEFNQVTLPFIDNPDKAQECVERIERESLRGNGQPIVFSTLVNGDVREVVRRANALFVDFFETFIGPLEGGLGIKSSHTIGRSRSSRIPITDQFISTTHARVFRKGHFWFVEDLGSLNGTYVNGRRVEEEVLVHGDEVQVGKFRLIFFSKADG